MSIYESLRKSRPRSFRVYLEANIDPCFTCVVKDARSPEHCNECFVNPDKKKGSNNIPNTKLNSSIVIIT